MKIDINYYDRQDYYDADHKRPVNELSRYVDICNHYTDQVIVSMRLDDDGFYYCTSWIEDSI
jgi:Rieske Fe-S protein